MREAIEQFHEAIHNAGLYPPEVIEPDGKLHRFASNGKRSDDAGWYVFYDDGIPAGAFGDWRCGLSETWRADIGRRLSPYEEAAHRARVEAIRREREADEAKRKAEVRKKAAAIWQAARPAPDDHAYLLRKGIKSHGLRVHDGALVVPMRDGAELHSLQFIGADGEKRFLTGGRTSGCYFPIGEPDGALCIAEGYATAASIYEAAGCAVAVAFNAGNLLAVAKALRMKFPDLRLIVCADDDASTPGNPGLTKARKAAQAAGALLSVPDFGSNRTDGATDFNDLHRHAGPEAVRESIERAAPAESGSDEDSEEARLMKYAPNQEQALTEPISVESILFQSGFPALSNGSSIDEITSVLRDMAGRTTDLDSLQRVALRATAINRLEDLGVNAPARLVDAALALNRPIQGQALQGQDIEFQEPAPWPERVDGAELLEEIAGTFSRYIVLPEWGAEALALWTIHTYCLEATFITPIIAIASPEKRCGKTLILDLLSALCMRPLPASSITPASLFRAIEKYSPTLLIDEGDSFLRGNEELRGVINSGHRQSTAWVIRTVGDDHEPRRFRTWGAKAIALIGSLPETIEDRSILIRMRRKSEKESVEYLRQDRLFADLEPLRRRIVRWVKDNREGLRAADPEIPKSLNDRARDNWRPLLAISDRAGQDWPSRARKAAVALSGSADQDQSSITVQLLADLRELFQLRGTNQLASEDIVEALGKMEERPWPEWKNCKPITTRQLARLLKPFDVQPRQLWIDAVNRKGYAMEDLSDALSRYLPTSEGLEGLGLNEINGLTTVSDPLDQATSSGSKTAQEAYNHTGSSPLADQKGETAILKGVFSQPGPAIMQKRDAAGIETRSDAGVCYACRSTEQWRRTPDGPWVCITCHPAPELADKASGGRQ